MNHIIVPLGEIIMSYVHVKYNTQHTKQLAYSVKMKRNSDITNETAYSIAKDIMRLHTVKNIGFKQLNLPYDILLRGKKKEHILYENFPACNKQWDNLSAL